MLPLKSFASGAVNRSKQMQRVTVVPSCLRVLVVDDDPIIAALMVRELKQHFHASAVHDGREALVQLAMGNEYDVILLDVHMPKMSGIGVYKRASLFSPEIAKRIVFVSGGTTSEEADFLASIPNEHVRKPVPLATLLEVVERVGDRRIAQGSTGAAA